MRTSLFVRGGDTAGFLKHTAYMLVRSAYVRVRERGKGGYCGIKKTTTHSLYVSEGYVGPRS